MRQRYEAVVIGAGHNGLTCACYLARAGLKVLVLEQYHAVGGMTVTEEETLPGFRSDIHASGYQLANLSPVPHELGLLDRYELIEPQIPYSHAFPGGGIISVNRDIEKTVAEIARYSQKDGETWRALIKASWRKRTPSLHTCSRLPRRCRRRRSASPYRLRAWRRIDSQLQSLRSWANETFESEATKSLFASFATFFGASPDDAGGAELGWLFASVLQNVGNNLVKGGMNRVTLALAHHLQAHGGEIRTNARAERITGDAQRATGVRLANGEEVTVDRLVVSDVDPGHLVLDLLGSAMVGEEIVSRMGRYEWGDSVFVMFVALEGPITDIAGPQPAGVTCPPHRAVPRLL